MEEKTGVTSVDGEHDVTPTIRGVITVPGATGQFRILQKDREELILVAKTLRCSRSFLPLAEVVRIIDRRVAKAARAVEATTSPDDARRAFGTYYAAFAATAVPTLELSASNDGEQANTRSFRKLSLKHITGAWPRHEHGPGQQTKHVNVLIPNAAHAIDVVVASGILDGTGYEAHRAKRSLAIRAPTPSLDPTKAFISQRESVEQGLITLDELVRWIRSNEKRLATVIGTIRG